jgi:hypothetical protein
MRAVYTAALAGRGFTGALGLFEGLNGLDRMFDQTIALHWADPALEVVRHMAMKKCCSLGLLSQATPYAAFPSTLPGLARTFATPTTPSSN